MQGREYSSPRKGTSDTSSGFLKDGNLSQERKESDFRSLKGQHYSPACLTSEGETSDKTDKSLDGSHAVYPQAQGSFQAAWETSYFIHELTLLPPQLMIIGLCLRHSLASLVLNRTKENGFG